MSRVEERCKEWWLGLPQWAKYVLALIIALVVLWASLPILLIIGISAMGKDLVDGWAKGEQSEV